MAVTGDLRRQARQLGRRLRWHVGARSQEEALRAATILYRQIGIELSARNGGLVEMTSCFFSRAYDPQVCRIMSAMDEGLFSGLTDGSTLSFERRITEGATSCVASLRAAEACTRSS